MAQPDNIGPVKLDFDAEHQSSSFQVSSWRRGKPFVVSGCLPVSVPAGSRLPQIADFATKSELKDFLRDLIATL